MAATTAERAMPGANPTAADTDGRKACMFSTLTANSLLARDKLVAGTANLEARGHGGSDLRWRIDDSDARRL